MAAGKRRKFCHAWNILVVCCAMRQGRTEIRRLEDIRLVLAWFTVSQWQT
jgi:hypothetical protein